MIIIYLIFERLFHFLFSKLKNTIIFLYLYQLFNGSISMTAIHKM